MSDNKNIYIKDLPSCITEFQNQDLRTMIENMYTSVKNKGNKLNRVRRYIKYQSKIYNFWITFFSLSIVAFGIITAGITAYSDTDLGIYFVYTFDGFVTLIAASSAILSRLKTDTSERIEDIFNVLANMAEFTTLIDKFVYLVVKCQVIHGVNLQYDENENVYDDDIPPNDQKTKVENSMELLLEKNERIVREYSELEARFCQVENTVAQREYIYEKGCLSMCCCIRECLRCCEIERKPSNISKIVENNEDAINNEYIV